MKSVYFVERTGEISYIILAHPEGFTAYNYNEIGGTLEPVAHGFTPEEIAQSLSALDSDVYNLHPLEIVHPQVDEPCQ